jgi:hypothetical protein
MPKLYGTPGPRMVYPSTATSRKLARCSLAAQLLWDRLIAAADDQGRLAADPLLVKAACFPLVEASPDDIDGWLAELEAQRFIVRYEVAEEPLVQIRNWWEHQGGMRHAWPSRWPGPEGWPPDTLKGSGQKDEQGANGGQTGPNGAVGRLGPEGGGSRESAGGGPDNDDPLPVAAQTTTDLYRLYEALTQERADPTAQAWMDDLTVFAGTQAPVAAVMRRWWTEGRPHNKSLLGWTKHKLKEAS